MGAELLAHGFGGPTDLPLPLVTVFVGAGWALTVSFVVLAFSWRTSRLRGDASGRDAPAWVTAAVESPWLRNLVRAFGLLAAGWTAWAALAGKDSPANPALGVFYIYLWVGLVPLSLLVGNIWPLLSPVRTVHLGLCRMIGTSPAVGLRPYPAILGYWPAAIGLFAFVWTELVDPDSALVSTVATWCLLYAAVMLVGSAVFGSRWFERADPFEVWFGLVARLSVWGWRDSPRGRRVVVRNPLDNLDGTVVDRGLVAVVSVLLGSTAFDSFSASNWWIKQTAVPGAFDPTLRDTLVLLAFVAFVAISFSLAAMASAGFSWSERRALPRQLAHSLVPIGVGYVFAHYLTLLLESGQRYLIYLSDPLVTGRHDYLGTMDWQTYYFLSVRPGLVAILKVVFVLTGHIAGVVAAHDRAVRLLPARHVIVGQLAMLVVMLVYTGGGLLLLFNV